MNFIERFRLLPISSRRLLSIGMVFALVVALPLFIWAIVTQKFLFSNRAATGEPTPTPTPTCKQRPACLDAVPHPCLMPEPAEGWCPTPTAASECEMCGGIAETVCSSGLVCPLSVSDYPDQSGVCVKPDGSSNCFVSPSPTPTPPPSISCNETCGNNYGCSAGLTCYNGTCRNPSCVVNENCTCGTPTPSPSPSPYVPIYQSFTVRVRFAGVNNEGADEAKITLRFENPSRFFDYTTSPFGLEYIGNGIYQADLVFGSAVPPLTADNHYAIYVKGEKHLASKFCQQTGQTVRCTGVGNIIIPPATSNPASYVLDFSGLPLEPGDLSPQDGAANTSDFAKITALLIKPHSALTAQDLMVGDLNYDGYVNILDAFLMRQTLQTRYDEN